jgi:hypothetical protein
MPEFSYDDKAIREDLTDFIVNLTPTESTLYSGLGKVKAQQPLHQWSTDTLRTVGTNAQVEGFTPAYAARTRPSRATNWTQILSAEVEVTETERASLQAGFADRYTYEMDKAMTEWVDDAEYALMRGGLITGTGSAARYMQGFKASVTTTVTSQSGVSLSEQALNDYFQNTWAASRIFPDEVFVGGTLKRRISGFTSGTTKFLDVSDHRLINTASVYESDFGIVKILLHRYITVSGDVGNDVLGIRNDLNKIAQLRPPAHQPMAKSADSVRGMVVGEITLEYRNQLSSFLAQRHS